MWTRRLMLYCAGAALAWAIADTRSERPELPSGLSHEGSPKPRKLAQGGDATDSTTSELPNFRRLTSQAPHMDAPEGQGGGEDRAQDAPPGPARRAAQAFREQRRSIFFDGGAFVAAELGRHDDLVAQLLSFLATQASPEVRSFAGDQPDDVLDRMAAIDLLQKIATARVSEESDCAARAALGQLASSPVPRDAPPASRRAAAGERYDAFVALTRIDRKLACCHFKQLGDSRQVRAFYLRAIHAGLLDIGVRQVDLEAASQACLEESACVGSAAAASKSG